MKNKIILILSCILVLGMTIGCLVYFSNNTNKNDNESFDDSYDQAIYLLTKGFQSDIIIYGENIHFRKGLSYRTITEISKENLVSEKKYQFFIVSDLDGTLTISNDEWNIIKECILENRMNFYYLGTDKLGVLKRLEFYSTDRPQGDYCLGWDYYDNELGNFSGIWNQEQIDNLNENIENMGESFVLHFARIVRSNES